MGDCIHRTATINITATTLPQPLSVSPSQLLNSLLLLLFLGPRPLLVLRDFEESSLSPLVEETVVLVVVGILVVEVVGNDDGDDAGSRNKNEAILALAEVGRSLESLPKDLAAAIEAGRVPGSIVSRYLDLEKSAVFRWLLQFGGFKERLLADDLFLTKVAIECGVGIFTKTAAELERRREKFTKELDFVVADVVMAIIADFMLVWLPAPTVSLRPPLAVSAGQVAKFFYSCPDNAFQVALAGTSYSFAQRIGAIMRNGSKLFAVGTGASLIGVGITNALIKARKALDKSFAGEAEDVPVLSTSVAYGVYMAVSSNLRYQILAGVIEQRILEPMLHQHKVALSAICFVVRTGNTFLGITDVGGLCTLGWNPKGTRVECRDGKFGRDFSMAAAADGLMDIGERGWIHLITFCVDLARQKWL
ncbi:hypothetical protein OIU85_001391 [Salix viminalis]|uniref:Uncharacterized protein n=1 Tax=Salix viminalis TaxID=40686 RepID=A0A9Q0VNP4_SALVM|nr:hypothetical protein OIU85_001391 [Salix viminalis]